MGQRGKDGRDGVISWTKSGADTPHPYMGGG